MIKFSINNKNLKFLIVILVFVIVLLGIIFNFYPYPFFGPFTSPPSDRVPNCSREYRFKYNKEINNKEDFISFLEKHQYNGTLYHNYEPNYSNLIPDKIQKKMIADNQTLDNHIKVDEFIDYVSIETSNALFSDEKIYTLSISNNYFNDSWPWFLQIKMSEKGHVSIKYCAGV